MVAGLVTGQFKLRSSFYETLVPLITRSLIDRLDVLRVSLPWPTLINKQSGGPRCILKVTYNTVSAAYYDHG